MRKRCRQVLSFVLSIPANGFVYATSKVSVVLRYGVCKWTVLITLRLSAVYFEDREMKT